VAHHRQQLTAPWGRTDAEQQTNTSNKKKKKYNNKIHFIHFPLHRLMLGAMTVEALHLVLFATALGP
jgi:hypothetical protein